ncbi:hypothetical protein ELK23_28305, partial [Klebsiella pneumoniae]|nr:hypothetical protein [Klebsiella pneumoniae]
HFGRIFDPTSLLGPFLMYQKLFTQEVLQQSDGWDTPLTQELKEEAKKRIDNLTGIQDITVNRRVSPSGEMELLGFGNASKVTYG